MTGCIYKSDALNVITKLINENKRQYDTSFHKGKRDALIEALKEIEKIKAIDLQPVNQWISIKDRLPDDHVIVLVYDIYCGIVIGWYNKRNNVFATEFINRTTNVTHWMPLPEPPKGGKIND